MNALAIVRLDIDDTAIMDQIGARKTEGGRLPVVAVTPRAISGQSWPHSKSGLDDILDMPFAVDELAARVIALLRRSYGDAVTPFTPAVINLGELELDILNCSLRVGILQLHLTSLEQIRSTCWRPRLVVSSVAKRSWAPCGEQTT